MRLWHQQLIPILPKQWLLGQHREVCALRGMGWYRKHKTVDFIHNHPFYYLVAYHMVLIRELLQRQVRVDPNWLRYSYRGKRHSEEPIDTTKVESLLSTIDPSKTIYPEHDNACYKKDVADLQKAIHRYNQHTHKKPISFVVNDS